MVQLSEYAINVVNNFSFIGMWIAALICCRNFSVSLKQYQRTRGKIHLVNLGQISALFIHRVLFGIIPLFEIETCAYFPLLISLWHITYILFYVVMFMRLIILELDRYSRWIRIVGVLLITLRAADWPYELAFHSIQERLRTQSPQSGAQCWAEWGTGVIILNFVGDSLANLFLSGMFVRRLFIHINMSKSLMSHQNKVIEKIARKSLLCLAFTFVVNLAMNLIKVTELLGNHSDAFTVYFEIIESTLLVEALRNDGNNVKTPYSAYCENCHKEISNHTERSPNNDDHLRSQMLVKSFQGSSDKNRLPSTLTEGTTFNEHPMHPVSSYEPAMFKDRRTSSFSNSIRYNGDSSMSRALHPLSDQPPSPKDRTFSNQNSFSMVTTTTSLDNGLSPRPATKITSKTDLNGNTDNDRVSYGIYN